MNPIKNITVNIRYFIESVKQTVKWFPVIWNDRDWDYVFFFKILHKKLEMMEKSFRSDDCFIKDNIKIADRIRVAKLITKRIVFDNYHSNVYYFHDQKWGNLNGIVRHSKTAGVSAC